VSFVKYPFSIEKQYRLKKWNYSSGGYYFVTICCQDRKETLGRIGKVGIDHCVYSSIFGRECQRIWKEIPSKFDSVYLDEFIFMPDHIHGIVVIKNNYERERKIINKEQTQWSVPTVFGEIGILGQIIRWFKSMTTNEYINNMKKYNLPRFNKRIWQPRFYDRIIRNEKEYLAIKQYIIDNPKKWSL